jgi:AraC-like DNA-binding protein
MPAEPPSVALDPELAGGEESLSSAYLATVLPDLAAHYGLDTETLLTAAGLAPDLLEQGEQFLPLVDVVRLFVALMERAGDPGLGFETGKRVRPRAYQVLGYAILSSQTLGGALDRLTRFEKLVGNLGTTSWERHGERIRMSWRCPISGAPRRFLVEAAVTGWVAFARQLVDYEAPSPEQVAFSHGPPPDPERYEAWFRCPVRFRADFDGVEFDAGLLERELAGADPGLNELMEREARQLLADYDSKANLVNAVRSRIYRGLADGEPTMEQVAAELEMSPRTLQHRLSRQGMTFQEVLDGLRRSLAELYLRDPGLSLTDIALLLGFAEQSSFTRAFRRWRGVSPAAWRRRLRQND